MKQILLSILIVLILSGCYQNLGAVTNKIQGESPVVSSMSNSQEYSISYSDLQKGASFVSNRESFVFLPELYSLINRKKNKVRVTSNIAKIQNEKSATLFQKKGGFGIYKTGAGVENQFMTAQSVLNLTLYPVVLNTRTNQLGIVVGNISVILIDMNDAETIASELDLNVKKKYDHLKTVYFKIREGQDIISLHQSLINDTRIKSASIKVLENFNVPH